MSEPILKTCPFCGEFSYFGGDDVKGYYVSCSGVRCYALLGEGTFTGVSEAVNAFNTKQQAADAWNNRKEGV